MSLKDTDEHYRLYREIKQLRDEVHALTVLQLSAAIRMSPGNNWDTQRIAREAATMVKETLDLVGNRG